MHVVVLVVERVVVRASPKIAILIEEELSLVGSNAPHSDVKLPSLKQHRLLYVLLNDPVGVDRLRREKLLNLHHAVEDFNPSALIKVGWLYKPVVLSAVLLRSAFLRREPVIPL